MDELLNRSWAAEFSVCLGKEYVKKAITEVLEEIRREISSENGDQNTINARVEKRVKALLHEKTSSTLKAVVNATGVIIHTNLGRAPLTREALKAVYETASAYSTLEYSCEKGGRSGRNTHIEWLICHITGAEAALVVNNNAAAVLLTLSALARGREVIVSNGELVEIGDSFRIPEILSFSGAKMAAVGCTNSTRLTDYEKAINENTAILLKVHPSNYRIEGFTASTSREELSKLASSRGLVFMEDLGSGLLCHLKVPFVDSEHSVRDCLKAGAHIVTFSGDKLLGGPQIGVIAGSKQLIDKMRSHQLLRALRVDKMTLAAFEATLRMYITGRHAEIPVIRMIEADSGSLLKKARRLCNVLKQAAQNIGANDLNIEVVEACDVIGGGAFPTDQLPGYGVGIHCASRSTESIAAAFRAAPVPVISGIKDEKVILHVRTLLDGDEQKITAAFSQILSDSSPGGSK